MAEVHPDARPVQPDAPSRRPVQPHAPSRRPVQPDSQPLQPDSSTSGPVQPDARPAQPDPSGASADQAGGQAVGPRSLVVGQAVEYYCRHVKRWKMTTITQKRPNGNIHIAARSTALKPAEHETRLRLPPVAAATPCVATQLPSRVASKESQRERGTYSEAWVSTAHKWIAAFGSVPGVFAKFEASFPAAKDMKCLKAQMSELFGRSGAPGVDYGPFQKQPGRDLLRGHILPCSENEC